MKRCKSVKIKPRLDPVDQAIDNAARCAHEDANVQREQLAVLIRIAAYLEDLNARVGDLMRFQTRNVGMGR